MVRHDDDLAVYADGEGRRGAIDRRKFIRMGVLGTAMASAMLMDRDREAGAEAMKRRTVTGAPRAAGLVEAGPELALPPGFSYTTFGAFGSAMTDGFITPADPRRHGGVRRTATARSVWCATTSSVRATTSRPAP